MKILLFMVLSVSFVQAAGPTCEEDDVNKGMYMIGMTEGHNVRRCRHGTPNLKWDPALA